MINNPLASDLGSTDRGPVSSNASRLGFRGSNDLADGLKKGRNAFLASALLLPAVQLLFADTVAAGEVAADPEAVARLERQITKQQQQVESLQQQVNQLKSKTTELASGAPSAPGKPTEKVVTHGGAERTKLSISGWVNRMVNVVNDGDGTEAYFVDNDNSESRLRFRGTHEISDDLTAGAYIELTIASNRSVFVSQVDQERNNDFDQRWAEVYFDSQRYGKLSVGKGNVAAHGTAIQDLSGTNLIQYATIVDTAGGMLFREKDTGDLTDIRILDAFNSFDGGLFRKNRVRYDTPSFYGFQLAASAISDNRYDGALYWKGQGYGFKAKAGAGITDPNLYDAGHVIGGSFSVLHEDTGLNLTVSAGSLDRDEGSNPTNRYAKLGWRKRLNSFGETAFSTDYTDSKNLPVSEDKSNSWGLAVVQNFDKYGLEIYGAYRRHSLNRRNYSLDGSAVAAVDNIDVLSIGTRLKF